MCFYTRPYLVISRGSLPRDCRDVPASPAFIYHLLIRDLQVQMRVYEKRNNAFVLHLFATAMISAYAGQSANDAMLCPRSRLIYVMHM
jgi:hypothetical protein